MSFEIRERDLLARIGRLKTKGGVIETPTLFPVINPVVQPIQPNKIMTEFGCGAIITNAYIIRKHFKKEAVENGLHNLLDFPGVIMTDSGAYQILKYGKVEVSPKQIVEYQEAINSDIATMLDVPTGWGVSRQHAEQTVNETVKRAKALTAMKTRNDIIWVGPIQGGSFLDLISQSARTMGQLPFHIHALGSPTTVMEQYFFDTLVEMIMTAKKEVPLNRPFHLFGAGHPFMFALAVALGCDLFDSAAYAIFARKDRYLTKRGTINLCDLEYLPCSCPVCVKHDCNSLRSMLKVEREQNLARHNLYVSFSELRQIKQALVEGRLWEHLELRAHSHPSLFQAFKQLEKYSEYIEQFSPITKKSGLFFFNSLGLSRPEVFRHRKRLFQRYSPPKNKNILVLLPQTQMKPSHKSSQLHRVLKYVKQRIGDQIDHIHFCIYAAPFGVVPTELKEVYPLSQHVIAIPIDVETIVYVTRQVATYITSTVYKKVVLLQDMEILGKKVATVCNKACRKKSIPFTTIRLKQPLNKDTLNTLVATIQNTKRMKD